MTSGGPLRGRPSPSRAAAVLAAAGAVVGLGAACDAPHTAALVENRYPTSGAQPSVIYRAFWQSVAFAAPVPPGGTSDPQPAIPASPNTAYVLLAPGWDPGGAGPPASLVVLRSRGGFALHLNDTLRIAVDDSAFTGNCAAGSPLPQEEADFITQRIFRSEFEGLRYDAATCTTAGTADGAGPR